MNPDHPAIFIADCSGLDFLNSVATVGNTPNDWIADGEGLVAWLSQAKLVPLEALEGLRKRAKRGELDKIAGQARGLREWFRDFVHNHMGQPLTPSALPELARLDRLLERDQAFSQLKHHHDETGDRLELYMTRRWQSPESWLLPIGEALARFVCDENFADVKACEGIGCTLMFVDHTRRRVRRWCSMATCGNRTKQSAHRRRLESKH
jgi:predicted RNA-binding Zn ribbon-like protein